MLIMLQDENPEAGRNVVRPTAPATANEPLDRYIEALDDFIEAIPETAFKLKPEYAAIDLY